VVLTVAFAAPASAKVDCDLKPEHPVCAGEDPGDDPILVDVAMTGALATTCNDGDKIAGTMVMQRDADGLSPAAPTKLVLLYLDIPGVDASRQHPDPVIASGFSNCHGEQLDGTASPYGGLFITLDNSGAVTDVLWHFDYYLETVTRGNREVMSLMEHFTLSGHGLTWNADTSTASGSFNVLYHLEDRENHVSVGYEEVEGSPVYLEFTLTMEPHSGG
jgi:hypothetical protein